MSSVCCWINFHQLRQAEGYEQACMLCSTQLAMLRCVSLRRRSANDVQNPAAELRDHDTTQAMAGRSGAAIAEGLLKSALESLQYSSLVRIAEVYGRPAMQHRPLGGKLALHTSSTCWPMKFSIRLKFTRGQGTGRSIARELSPLRPLLTCLTRSVMCPTSVSPRARCRLLKLEAIPPVFER